MGGSEKNKGIKDDFQVPSLGDRITSSHGKYLYILIQGRTPGKDDQTQ